MRHITLESFMDDYGNLGLILAGAPRTDSLMADTNGGLIAHDLLEHQNGPSRIGDIDDEIEALGACWQIRGRHGDFCNDDPRIGSAWTPEQNTILGLATVARDAAYAGWQPKTYHTRPHDEDETFIDMLDWVRPHVRGEIEDEPGFPLEAFLENSLHLIRTGYRKAERRFGDRYDGLDQFRAIKNAIKPHAHHAEHEGRRFRLSYGAGTARCEEIYA